jgi:protein phosphatase
MTVADFSLAGPRGENQDAAYFSVLGPDSVIAMVADGVGGLGGGRLASECVKRAAFEASEEQVDPASVIREAHRYVNELSIEHAATTATVVACEAKRLRFAHTGDSRIYVVRGTGLRTLTQDQTEAAFLVKDGVLTPAAARTYHRRNVLMHAVQKDEPLEVQTGEFELQVGDRILLVTDGIYKVLTKQKILEISASSNGAKSFSQKIKLEIESRLQDDASLVAIDVQ